MKLLILILITFSLNGQPLNSYPKDYHYHVQGSILLQGCITSFVYWKTERNVFSNFMGVIGALSIGLAKEYVYDKAMKRGTFSALDIEADVRGCLYGGVINSININVMERKNYIDTLKYKFR